MDYLALFLWLALCLVLGGLMHSVIDGTLRYRPVRILAAPGIIVRKLSLTIAALLCGGRVTNAHLYELRTQDVDFGPAGVSRVIVPLAPLFGCALALLALNHALGHPLHTVSRVPPFTALDASGVKGFATATWQMLADVIRQSVHTGWREPRAGLLLVATFGLGLGSSTPLERIKEPVLGSALLAVAVALTAAMSARHGVAGVTTQPPWFAATRDALLATSAAAFIMLTYGLFTALLVGIAVRVYEVLARGNDDAGSKPTRLPPARNRKRAA